MACDLPILHTRTPSVSHVDSEVRDKKVDPHKGPYALPEHVHRGGREQAGGLACAEDEQ